MFSAPDNAGGCDRLDQWLWAVRLFKTRGLATAACRGGAVKIAGQTAKPARDVRVDEVITVRQGVITRTLRVTGVPRSRVGAKRVPEYCAELTPPEEFAKAREQPFQDFLAREKGSGRPTKRDRRSIDRLFQ
ncbi:MAG TPA: RNA-binding S4 domain-containing protein [Opitutus sp.]|nr:RNA-binding S4 domain-containing protein [Opitutus sp.]